MEVTIDKQRLVEGLKSQVDLEALKEKLKGFHGIKIFKLPAQVLAVVAWAVAEIEQLVEDLRELGDTAQYGKAKREAVVGFFDDVFKLPFWLEAIDGYLIGFAVDAVVGTLNLFLGKEWRKKVQPAEVKQIALLYEDGKTEPAVG